MWRELYLSVTDIYFIVPWKYKRTKLPLMEFEPGMWSYHAKHLKTSTMLVSLLWYLINSKAWYDGCWFGDVCFGKPNCLEYSKKEASFLGNCRDPTLQPGAWCLQVLLWAKPISRGQFNLRKRSQFSVIPLWSKAPSWDQVSLWVKPTNRTQFKPTNRDQFKPTNKDWFMSTNRDWFKPINRDWFKPTNTGWPKSISRGQVI